MAKKAADGPSKHTVSGQLRDVIGSRGLTHTELGQLSGVDPTVIARFVSGEREVRNGTFDKIASALGLRLVEVAVARPKGKAKTNRS